MTSRAPAATDGKKTQAAARAAGCGVTAQFVSTPVHTHTLHSSTLTVIE